MHAKDAIRASMDVCQYVLSTYVSDLSDADLMRRPDSGCNHLAWQLGHLISSEVSLLESICPGKGPQLPEGFAEQHSKEARQDDAAAAFRKKQEYLDLYQQVRQATLSALESLPDEQLDAPSPESFRQFMPTVGHMFTLIATHPLMHAGQFAVVRRQLGKPILI
jgi:uncharacterized damage-inducible protein DinB